MRKFFQDRPKLCTTLYILGFITSGILTFQLLTSNSIDTFSKIIAGSMTVILEFGKGITFIESQRKNKFTDGMKSLLFFMWLSLTLLSIFASQAWLVNETNKIANDAQVSSPLFLQAKDKEIRAKEQISIKKDLLNKSTQEKSKNVENMEKEKQDNLKLIDGYNKTMKEYQNKIDTKNEELQQAIFKKWVNTPEKLRNEISQLKDTMNKTMQARDKLTINDKTISDQAHIDQLNNDIDVLNKEINSIDYSKITGELPANGYLALFQLMSRFTGYQTSTVTFLFYLVVTILFEVLVCLLYHIAVVYSPTSTNTGSEIESVLMNKLQTIIDTTMPKNAVTSVSSNCINGLYKNNIGDNTEKIKKDIECFMQQAKFSPETQKIEEPFKTKNPIGFRSENTIYSSADKENTNKNCTSSPSTYSLDQKIEINIPDAIKKEDVQKYLKVMYDNTIKDIAPGSDRIARILTQSGHEMTKEQARKIRSVLEQHGIVQSHPEIKKTIVLKYI